MSEIIDYLGISPEGSVVIGDFTMTGDRVGQLLDEPDSFCVAVGGLAARYSHEELSVIGDGSTRWGEALIIQSVLEQPGSFDFGYKKPLAVDSSELPLTTAARDRRRILVMRHWPGHQHYRD